MPKFEIVKDAGIDFPVGKIIETDELHPSLEAHVKRVIGKVAVEEVVEQDPPKEDKPDPKPKKDPVKKEPIPKEDDDDNT